MKLLWNDEEYSKLKEDSTESGVLLLLKVTLLGKIEYEKIFLIYEKILNKYEVIEYLYSHSRKENYEYLKSFGGF